MPSGFQTSVSWKAGAMTATRITPAFTMVAECRYALTGVGAAIAPGSHTWNGACADFVAAAIRMSTAAAVAVEPVIGVISLRTAVPAASTYSTNPARSARPPPAVMTSARRAAVRATGSVFLKPTSRNEVIEVSSQNRNRVHTESAQTRPTIAPANVTRVAANRPIPAALAEK